MEGLIYQHPIIEMDLFLTGGRGGEERSGEERSEELEGSRGSANSVRKKQCVIVHISRRMS